MKINITVRLQLVNLEVGDHLDPSLYNNHRYKTRWGNFGPTEGPAVHPRYPASNTDLAPFVAAAKQELAALLAKHGVEALGGSVEIVPERVSEE